MGIIGDVGILAAFLRQRAYLVPVSVFVLRRARRRPVRALQLMST